MFNLIKTRIALDKAEFGVIKYFFKYSKLFGDLLKKLNK